MRATISIELKSPPVVASSPVLLPVPVPLPFAPVSGFVITALTVNETSSDAAEVTQLIDWVALTV